VVEAVPEALAKHLHILHQMYRELILLQVLFEVTLAAQAAREYFITSPDKNEHMAPVVAVASGVVEVTVLADRVLAAPCGAINHLQALQILAQEVVELHLVL
jgi:hypothetical protein